MKYFYDTEFLEDGRTIELISIGIVAEDGRQFYAVSDQIADSPLYERICKDQWLMENVVPSLPLAPNGRQVCHRYVPPGTIGSSFFNLDLNSYAVMPRRMIRNGVRDFLLANEPAGQAQLWAWYGAYDHVALCQLFGRMIDLPRGIPMWTNDLRQEMRRLGDPDGGPQQEEGHHNALEDARHLKVKHDWLADLNAATAIPGETR